MTKAKFCDLSPGARFKHEGRVYWKLGMNLARTFDQKHRIFPSEMAVEPLTGGGLAGNGEPESETGADSQCH